MRHPVTRMTKSRLWNTNIDHSSLSTKSWKKHILPPLALHVDVFGMAKWTLGKAYLHILWKWATFEIAFFLIKRHSNWTFLSFFEVFSAKSRFDILQSSTFRQPPFWMASVLTWTCLLMIGRQNQSTYFPKKMGTFWVVPPPSKSGKWRFRWSPTKNTMILVVTVTLNKSKVSKVVFGRTKDHHQLQRL